MGKKDREQEMESAAPGEAPETPGHVDEVGAPEPEEDAGPEAELAALQDRHLRLAAEFDNFRRRTRRELGDAGERARAELAGKLLELMDDLQRVAETPLEGTTTNALHEGIGLVARKFAKVLSDTGVEPVNPVDERFDPNLHEALMMTPTDDPEQDELVSHVVLIGYRLGDRLLRPARVTVYRHEAETS
ncbi:nucleotide exchange factor GrpE [Candidatus Palauibacter sp.]|uniref:nucleotide exchange factor GrpE n=1 Tax=Candidatus Palauibacter sp. TaxID=3101350 RepID=UPI003B02568D